MDLIKDQKLKIAVILGTARKGRESEKVAKLVVKEGEYE
jgi:NAD(P)H-dependent FMN reductase